MGNPLYDYGYGTRWTERFDNEAEPFAIAIEWQIF